jgi:hypothetical protein
VVARAGARAGCSRTSSGRRSASRSSAERSTTRSGDISGSTTAALVARDRLFARRPLPGRAGTASSGFVGSRTGWASSAIRPRLSRRGRASRRCRPTSSRRPRVSASASPTRRSSTRSCELVGHAPQEVAYVGDRVDNDVLPAAAAGLDRRPRSARAVGRLQATPPEARSARRSRSCPRR